MLLLALTLLVSDSSGFVIRPIIHPSQMMATKSSTTMVQMSSQGFNDKENNGNVLTRAAKTVASWFRPHKKETVDDRNDDLILSPTTTTTKSELAELMRPFPWPIRAMGESITRSVHRELTQEQRKAKPLLKEAQRLITKDKDLYTLLGAPVRVEPVFSSATLTTSGTGRKKTKRITDHFRVVGSKTCGIATLVADKYAPGHIQFLRVDVDGIHYDIDI